MRRVGLIAIVNLAGVLVLFALLEGLASLVYLGHEVLTTPGVPEREHNHVEHDTLLGWVNRPNVDLPDAYGPGVSIHTNAQRFRGVRDVSPTVPAGKLRIVCSGDSFTFAYGVGDEDAWCERLASLDPRLETVNMGLGGYGVDQAYLWYLRDGARLEHDVQVFAFLTDDFHRMRSDRFMGYAKPLLAVRGDSLVVTNLPVRESSWLERRRARHGETVARMRLVRLLRRGLGLDRDARAQAAAEREAMEDERVRGVVARIFAELRRVHDARGSRLVLVFLPGAWDDTPLPATEAWRAFVRDEAGRQGIVLLDLVEELRRQPAGEVQGLYAPNAHFSVAGNAWAADVLHGRLAPMLDSIAADGAPGRDRAGGQ
jgi:hypothetical protein